MTINAFILSWDMTGLESVVPISKYEDWEHQSMLDVLAGLSRQKNPLNEIVSALIMRARFNSQRHYEIYAIDCDSSIQEEDWRTMFEESPQQTADLVRSRGISLHSDRVNTNQIKIT
jgi:hypothetical protein